MPSLKTGYEILSIRESEKADVIEVQIDKGFINTIKNKHLFVRDVAHVITICGLRK